MRTIKSVLAVALLSGAICATNAQTTSATSSTEDWIKQSKNPASWLSWGGDLRLRNEYFNNALSLDENLAGHEQDYFRLRARVWAAIKPFENFSVNVRLTEEARQWMKPSFHAQPALGFDWQEGIIDALNIKWANIADSPVTLTAGRQDIMLGDTLNWWLVADGTPGDGSRTLFFDAARLTVDLMKDYATSVDAIYIDQCAMNDRWLPPINGLDKYLTEQNERGVILYASNKSIEKTQVDGYFIYKHDQFSSRATQGADTGYNPAKVSNNADIFTLGTKITGDVADNWKYSVEGAYQLGEKNDNDISAFGVNSRLTYLFKDDMNNQLRLNYEYLSGDDQGTKDDEGFDLLWGRWPRFSELYIYSYAKETRIAQINNLHRVGPGWSITPVKNLTFNLEYNALFADQTRAASTVWGDGSFRGHFLQSWVKYKYNDHLSAHLWGELVFMGDYYAKRDMMTFIRAEINLTY